MKSDLKSKNISTTLPANENELKTPLTNMVQKDKKLIEESYSFVVEEMKIEDLLGVGQKINSQSLEFFRENRPTIYDTGQLTRPVNIYSISQPETITF